MYDFLNTGKLQVILILSVLALVSPIMMGSSVADKLCAACKATAKGEPEKAADNVGSEAPTASAGLGSALLGLGATDPPIACLINEEEIIARQKVSAVDLYERANSIAELERGYQLSFKGDDETIETILEFVTFERKCCPFLKFEVAFERNAGAVVLTVSGGDGVKEFLKSVMMKAPVVNADE